MSVRTMCPHCCKRYTVDEKSIGKSAVCKGCGQKFVLENLSGPERSAGGVPIHRPELETGAGKLVAHATPFLNQISRHIERNIGPVPSVFHEIVSTDVHIDLHVVPAQPHVGESKERPLGGDYVTIVTSGMSSKPMNVPPKAKEGGVSPYAELMLALPKDWPGLNADGTFDQAVMKNEANWWPFRWLKQMARMPHEYDTFFHSGVTVPNGDPPKPFAKGTKLCCWMVFRPLLCPKAHQLHINDDLRIDFFTLFALTEPEINLKLAQGTKALINALADGEVYTELLDPHRRSVV